jgi:hypothetical protein
VLRVLIARIEPIALASLPAIRARRRPGAAIAAMIPMIATTSRSSISVKPSWSLCNISCSELGAAQLRPITLPVLVPEAAHLRAWLTFLVSFKRQLLTR